MRAEILKVHRAVTATAIYVTHDQVEAMTMGDRIAVMNDGVIQQLGTPDELYDRPVNRFVGGFIGTPAMSFLTCDVQRDAGVVSLRGVGVRLRLPEDRAADLPADVTKVVCGIRPEHFQPISREAAGDADCVLEGVVEVVEPLGSEQHLIVDIGDETAIAKLSREHRFDREEKVALTVDPARGASLRLRIRGGVPTVTDRITMVRSHRVAPRWIFVEVGTHDGLTGWGEAIVPKRAAAVVGAVEDLARNIIGEDPSRVEDLWQRMSRGGFFRDGPVLATAAAAIDHALWDIKGRRHGLPIHEFLGGAVRDHVRLYAWVGGDRPNDVVAQVKARLDQGFTAVKMNATEELDLLDRPERLDAVVARVDAIRSAYGDTVDVALDFHGRVHRAMAKALLRELDQFRLLWVEEPLPPGQEDLLPEIARCAGGTPLATGERLLTRAQFARLLELRVIDVIQPDVSLTGLFELEKICRMAEAYDVAVAPHCPNGPISLAASLQVDFCAGNVVIQEQSLGLHYNRGYAGLPPGEMADYLVDPAPLSPVDGCLARPVGPGLGIEIDTDSVLARTADWALPDPVWRVADGRYAER